MDSQNTPHHSKFTDHLLAARLKRVSQNHLEKFYKDTINKDDKPKNKAMLVEDIVAHYQIMLNNSEFQEQLGIFIRDYVLSARESEHLIEINDKQAFITWVNNWAGNTYVGHSFNFYKHIYLEVPEQYLCLNKSDILETTIQSKADKEESQNCLSFPNQIFLLVAYKKESKSIFSRDRLLAIHDTREFEIIFRANSSLVSVRGENSVIRDFFSSVVEDANHHLSSIKSLFVGDEQGKSYRPFI